MVELVHDDDVEGVRCDLRQPVVVQRLDHREDVPTRGDPAAAVDLAERPVAQHRAIGRQRLPQDLLAVRDEQQRQVAAALRRAAGSRARRRRSCRFRSPRRRGCDAGRGARARPSAPRASAAGADTGRTSRLANEIVDASPSDRRSCSRSASLELLAVDRRVVGLEVLRRPMALERHPHAVDDVRRIHRRQPHVPLQPVEQRGVRQVRRADERRASARSPARAATPWRAAWSSERRARPAPRRRARTSSSTARFSVAPMYVVVITRTWPPRDDLRQRLTQVADARPDHEGADQIDRVRGRELGAELGADVRLALRVDEQVALAERRRR